MKTITNLVIGVAIGAMMAAAIAMLTPRHEGSASSPLWPLVDSDNERETFTQEQLQKGSGLLWQIYAQGYRDGQAHAPASGNAGGGNVSK